MLFVKTTRFVGKIWMSWRKPQSFRSIIMLDSKVYLSECSKRRKEGRNICICSQMSRDARRPGCEDVTKWWTWAYYVQVRGTIVAWECWDKNLNNSIKTSGPDDGPDVTCQCVMEVWWHFNPGTWDSFPLQQFYWLKSSCRGQNCCQQGPD